MPLAAAAKLLCLLVTLQSTLQSATAELVEPHNISLVVMAPFPDELTIGFDRGPSLIPAARIAAREINNSTEILPHFNLQLIVADSGCGQPTKVTISFLRDIYENKKQQVVGIVGPACSGPTLRVSGLTLKPQVSLIHITPTATSPELEDPKRITTYASISSALIYAQIFIALMQHNGWDRVATLVDESRPYFKQAHSGFLSTVDSDKVIFTGSMLVGRTGIESIIPLNALISSRARVVMVFTDRAIGEQLFCYAYHQKMMFPNYQWVLHERSASNFVKNISAFTVDGRRIQCTEKQMVEATFGMVINRGHVIQERRNATLPLFQKTYNEFFDEYTQELEMYGNELQLPVTPDPNQYANTYHDAVWAMALALHNASANGVDLTTYTYNRNNDTKEIMRHLDTVDFDGVSGPVKFQSATRSVQTVINILQVVDGAEVLIGTFDRTKEPRLQFPYGNQEFISDTYEEQHRKIHISIGVITILATVILLVLIALLQLANTIWYGYRSIKATSPNITHLVFSGCYLFSIALLILTVQDTFVFSPRVNQTIYAVFCNLFTWCFLLGYSLIFGTICVKIWRVYRLFRHFRNERPGHFLSDNALIMFVTILLTIDVIICITWNWVDPWVVETSETFSTSGTPRVFIRSKCTCQNVTSWVIAVSLYKGTIAILLVALSILNRRIKRKDFQHTRKINILIYSVTMLVGVGLPLYFLLDHISIYIGFIILVAILLSTILLSTLTLFLPPVIPVLKFKLLGIEEERPERATLRRALSGVSFTTSLGE